ncbi:MAG: hypothetical protein ACK5NF_01050 [Bacilli bacterium]
MIRLEFIRSLRNRNFIFYGILNSSIFLLSYIMMTIFDNIDNIIIEQILSSIYTSVIQFGPLILSIVAIYSISTDYKEKNIAFYNLCDMVSIKYYLVKLCINFFGCLLWMIMCVAITCIIFSDFSMFFNYIMPSMIVALCTNVAFWIGGIIISASYDSLKWFAFYDAGNEFSKSIIEILVKTFLKIVCCWMLLVMIILLRKRWWKNGL